MATPIVNLAGTIVGLGIAATTAVVPVALFVTGGGHQEQHERSDLVRQADVSHGQSIHNPQINSPKSHEQWGVEDFKNNCYGGFLKEEGKGELVVCVDKSKGEENTGPIFYLRWTETGQDEFIQIADISLTDMIREKKKKIAFELQRNSHESKSLTVEAAGQEGLNTLQVSRSRFNSLQTWCKESKQENEGYRLTCKNWEGEYNKLATKLKL